MNDFYDKNMFIIMGGTPQKTQEKQQLSDEDKKKLQESYMKTFHGLAFANWMRGMTLGAAWHQALGQIKTFVNTKNGNNPAAMYLRQFNAAHAVAVQKQMMTHQFKDAKLKCPPEKFAEINKKISAQTNAGLAAMNGCIAQYNVQQQAQKENYADAQAKMQQILQLQMQKIMAQQQQKVA